MIETPDATPTPEPGASTLPSSSSVGTTPLTDGAESPPSDDALTGPATWYADRRDRFRTEAAEMAVQAARLANQRLLLFLGLAIAAGWAFFAEPPLAYGLWILAAVLLGWFVVWVRRYRRVERRRRHLAGLADLADEALLRIGRDWNTLPLRHEGGADALHPYANDLDVVGHGSLLHLLESTGTRHGESTLRAWLLDAGMPRANLTEPAGLQTVRERQAAVAELAPLAEWREELVWRGRATGTPSPDPEPFLAWAEGEPFLASRQALVWGARISPPLFWILLLAQMAGLVAWPLWIGPVLVNLLLGWRLVGTAVGRLSQVRYFADALGAYADTLDHLGEPSFQALALQRLQAALQVEGHAAAEEIRRLYGIVRLAQPASSMVYPLIELTTLWNVHVLGLLEGWQARTGHRARGWFEALGEAEALAAFARLQHDNPRWSLPTIDPAATRLEGVDLGHPLLRGDRRVTNDLTVGPTGTFLLVTGSNMSGKSTLLRAVGANVVLAQAGGPVCASSLRLPPLDVWTAMRISDSLERGVSFFMAELERLRDVVEAARAAGEVTPSTLPWGPSIPTAPQPPPHCDGEGEQAARTGDRAPRVLYLLDEILQGTNTAERQIAARRVIRLLLGCRAIGAVSTHDLTLADAPDLAAAAQAIHLTELVVDDADGARMAFDYRIRAGIARSTNALRLLDMVGLREPKLREPEDRRE